MKAGRGGHVRREISKQVYAGKMKGSVCGVGDYSEVEIGVCLEYFFLGDECVHVRFKVQDT